jgi:hypothetical protein
LVLGNHFKNLCAAHNPNIPKRRNHLVGCAFSLWEGGDDRGVALFESALDGRDSVSLGELLAAESRGSLRVPQQGGAIYGKCMLNKE